MAKASIRADLLRAACVVVDRDGVDRAGLRVIAAEAGVTTGSLTHHFASKDELLEAVLADISQRTTVDFEAAVATCRSPDEFVGLLGGLLPRTLDDAREWRVWFSFFGYAISRKALLEVQAARVAALRDSLAHQLNACFAGANAKSVAAALLALIDGFALQITLGIDVPADQVHAALADQLRVLGVE